MSSKKQQPQWWQVYAMLPVLAGALLLEMRLQLTNTEHIVAQLVILCLVFGYVQHWINTNHRALMEMDDEDREWQFKVYQFPAAGLTTATDGRMRPEEGRMFQLPEAGLKGVLSTTFEMDDFDESTAFPAGSEILFSEQVPNSKSTKV